MHPDHSNQLNSLNRIEGQIKGIKRMIENHRYCVDILTQIKAAKAALHKVELEVLKTHVHGCLRNAVTSNDDVEISTKINEVMDLIGKRM